MGGDDGEDGLVNKGRGCWGGRVGGDYAHLWTIVGGWDSNGPATFLRRDRSRKEASINKDGDSDGALKTITYHFACHDEGERGKCILQLIITRQLEKKRNRGIDECKASNVHTQLSSIFRRDWTIHREWGNNIILQAQV